MPIPLTGEWYDGYALDQYTLSSEYIGEDVFGHSRFHTTYTEIGKLLYSMKYNGHFDTSTEIATKCKEFMDKWLKDKKIDIIVAVPPTHQRDVQPVFLIGETLSALTGIPFTSNVLEKTSPVETKNIPHNERNLRGSIRQLLPAKRECNILLLDDILSTGSTANECARVLKQDKLVRDIYFLAIAKSKNG